MNARKALLAASVTVVIAGCSTTNSTPYKASTGNVIAIQQTFEAQGKKVSVGNVSMAPGIEASPTCRLLGPIKVAPGKSLAQYIKDAFIEELFIAKAYTPTSPSVINAKIEKIKFSSVTPASWDIIMSVSSTTSSGYAVSVNYGFDTSWDAYSACKNVADAFGVGVWEGVPLREVLWLTQPSPQARRVYYWGYHNEDPKQRFISSLPIGRVLDEPPGELPVMLCYKLRSILTKLTLLMLRAT